MPWKQSILDQVSRMNISAGGNAIRYQPVKVAKANKPLLVIGLGGIGLRIGRRIKDMFIERFLPATIPIPGLDDRLPSFTRFLAVDTDRYDMNTLGYQGSERCDIGDPNIASKLAPQYREILPSYITDWLNPNIVSKGSNGVDGAQGVRQIGRFHLFTNINKIIESISVALNQVMPGQGDIQVIIVAGLAGGTGAGTFMDMPYLVRHVAGSLALSLRVKITGILVTPDVFASLDGTTAGIKRANGYAGLKELDYWMEKVDRRASFEQQYTPTVKVKWDCPPYDDCILLSGKNVSGGAPADPRTILNDTLPGVVAEYITNMFADETRDQNLLMDASKDFGFSYSSYRSNVRANLAPQPKKFDVSRRYTVIGASNGQIPLQDMILTEAVFMFNKLKEYYDVLKTPDLYAGNEYTDFVQRIVGNCATELLAPINIKSPRDVAITQIRNSDHLAPHNPDIDATVKNFFDSLESRSMGPEAIEMIDERVRMLEQELVAMFVDPEKGPYYASRYIDATPGKYESVDGVFEVVMPHCFNLKQTLEGLRAAALARRNQSHNDYDHQQKLATNEYQEIRTNLIPPMQNGPIARRYYTACESVNMNKREYWRQDVLYRLYSAMIDKLDEISTQIFKPLCKTILELTKVFKDIEAYMNTHAFKLDHKHYCIDIVDLDVLIHHFKEQYMSPAKINDMIETLFRDMMRPYTYDPAREKYEVVDSKERWLVSDPHHASTTVIVNVRDNLQRVLNDFFRPFNSNTLLGFWKLQYPQSINPDGSLNLAAIVSTMGPAMTSVAAPMFLPDPVHFLGSANADILASEYVTIPQNAIGLTAALGTHSLRQVRENALTDRIFWLRSLDGVSLYHYGGLQTCEADYVRCAMQGRHPGVHLWENKINWKSLPNPLPRAARPENYRNDIQQAADQEMIKRIDTLMNAGKITVDSVNNKLIFSFNTKLTRERAMELQCQLMTWSFPMGDLKTAYAQMLETREIMSLPLEGSILTNYTIRYAKQDPARQLIYDMMMQRPAMVEAMEKDLEELEELEERYRACTCY